MKLIHETTTRDYIIYQSSSKLMCSVRRKENPYYIIKQFSVYDNQDELDNLPIKVRNKILKEII